MHPKTFCGEVQAGDPLIHYEDIPKILDLPRDEIDRLVEENYRQIREDVVNIVSSELEKQNRGEEEGDD